MRPDVATMFVSVLAATILFAATPNASAEMYKWTNDDGTTTYSNQPPADQATAQELTVIVPEPPRVELQSAPAPKPPEAAAKIESESPVSRITHVRPQLPQAVQDPCLRSSDPLCHQKHGAHYRPGVGYTPEPRVAEVPAVVPPARGATSSASGGGSVSGATRTKGN